MRISLTVLIKNGEGHHNLPTQTAQQPSKPPLLYQSSIESKMSTLSLYPRQSLNYVNFKANNWGPPSVPTDTNAKLLGDQVATTPRVLPQVVMKKS